MTQSASALRPPACGPQLTEYTATPKPWPTQVPPEKLAVAVARRATPLLRRGGQRERGVASCTLTPTPVFSSAGSTRTKFPVRLR